MLRAGDYVAPDKETLFLGYPSTLWHPPPNASQEVISAWNAGVVRLLEAGVTGRILLANVASPKGLPVSGRQQETLAENFPRISFVYIWSDMFHRSRRKKKSESMRNASVHCGT